MIELVLSAVWYILPAYVTNSSAVLFAGKSPIDSGAKFLDGKRLLGPGKTWKGFIGAVILGCFVGAVQAFFSTSDTFLLAIFLSVGAMFGDAVGSFVKRRLGLERGEAAPFLDQWDFLFGAFLLNGLGALFLDLWFPSLFLILLVLVLTTFLHLFTNWIAYELNLKSNPW